MTSNDENDVSVENFRRHQARQRARTPHVNGGALEVWITIVAVVITAVSTISSAAYFGDNALGVGIFAVFFVLRQISRYVHFYVLVVSVFFHIVKFLIGLNESGPSFDYGFLSFMSVFNLVILVPWSINLYLILYVRPVSSNVLEVLGSLGSAILSSGLAFLYFYTVYYYYDMPFSNPSEFEIPLFLGIMASIEAILFLVLMVKGR